MKRNKTDILPNFVVLKMYKYYSNTKFPYFECQLLIFLEFKFCLNIE